MNGTGVPLVTPFDGEGAVDHESLAALVDWIEERGVDFLVPCGSTSEAPLLAAGERAAVVETVAETASVPVVAGTGTPGLRRTRRATERAAAADADAALVVTPYYFGHDASTLAAYYRDLADDAPVPVYLYSVPLFTGVALEPGTVEDLATHPNVAGIKDSSGDLAALARIVERTPDEFSVLTGHGGVYAASLGAGADGGVLGVANLVPDRATDIYERHRDGDADGARALARQLVELNHATTIEHGIPGLKYAMRARGAPAGRARRPHRPVGADAREEIESLLDAALAGDR